VRFGFEHVQDGGSFTLTPGSLAQAPMPGSAAVSLPSRDANSFLVKLELRSKFVGESVIRRHSRASTAVAITS
jgi:hypothetical protein